MIQTRISSLAVLCLVTFCLSGCGGGPPAAKLVPVTGTVTIDDQPVENIMVQFVPKTMDETVNAPTSQALTGADGKFELFTTGNEKGAIAGLHLVTFNDIMVDRPAQGEEQQNPSRVPLRYSTDGIEVTVAEGKPLELKLTSN